MNLARAEDAVVWTKDKGEGGLRGCNLSLVN
jgi:hypothetical protein